MNPPIKKRSLGFAQQPIEMLESPAWCVLSLSARRLVNRIEIEFSRHGGRDNGDLPVTHANFIEYGIHDHAITPASREAEALGIIKVQRGRAGNAEFRWSSKFGLTYRPIGDAEPTNDWRRIKTIEEATAIARQARTVSLAETTSENKRPRKVVNSRKLPKVPLAETARDTLAETTSETMPFSLAETAGVCPKFSLAETASTLQTSTHMQPRASPLLRRRQRVRRQARKPRQNGGTAEPPPHVNGNGSPLSPSQAFDKADRRREHKQRKQNRGIEQ